MDGTGITVAELASYRLGRPASTGGDFEEASLPMMGGCYVCGASIAAYNAHPDRNGFLVGSCCATSESTYPDVATADRDIFGEDGPYSLPAEAFETLDRSIRDAVRSSDGS